MTFIRKERKIVVGLFILFAFASIYGCSDGPTSSDNDDGNEERITDQPISELPGNEDESIVNATYDLSAQSEATEEEISTIEEEGVQQRILRTEIEIAIDPDATVGQINELLEKYNAKIVDMLEGLPYLIIQIEDPGDEQELENVIQQLETEGMVEYVLESIIIEEPQLQIEDPESIMQKIPEHLTDEFRIAHQLAVRAHGVWNLEGLITEKDHRPTFLIADYFGDGVPGAGYNAQFIDNDFGTLIKNKHGYHVLGIVTGMHNQIDGITKNQNDVTGVFPKELNVRALDLMRNIFSTWNRKMNEIIKLIREEHQKNENVGIILNTSLNSRDRGLFSSRSIEYYAFSWIDKVRGNTKRENLENSFIHFTSAGNVGDDGERYLAKVNSMFAFAALENPSVDGDTKNKLENTFVVENRVFSRDSNIRPLPGCANDGSIMGGNLSAIGTYVYSFSNEPETVFLSGTSMSTPQAAGLASYIWSINPELSVGDLIDIINNTAEHNLKISDPDYKCNSTISMPVIDMYAAILATEGENARSILLNVDENGVFDEDDIGLFLNEFEERDGELDYSRYDLNASGQTGGNSTERFDLNDDVRFGKVNKSIHGKDIEFNENEVTDSEILCYYAYSDFFEGNPEERNNLLEGVCYKAENIPPTVEITGGPPDRETIEHMNPEFEWDGSDEDGSVDEYAIELNGPASEEFTIADNNYQFEDLSNGDYTFRIRAIDNEGAQSGWASREFTVAVETENQAPTVEITGGPSDGESIDYQSPVFEWEGNDEDGSIDEYRVELDGPDSEEFLIDDTDYQFNDLSYGDYEFRVRAIDNEGAKSSWASRDFTIEQRAMVPTVRTLEVSSITETSAESGGDVTDDGGEEVSVRGVCWSTSETPGFDDECTNNGGGTGEFTSSIEELVPDTKYYVRAYANNNEGIGYGDVLSFRTDEAENHPPTVEITGGPSEGETIDYTDPEFEWEGSDEDGVVEEYNVELNGPESDEFTTEDTEYQFEDLSYGEYEFRIRAIDNEGAKSTWASREFTVEKSATIPVVSTLEVSSITATSAESGGDVTDGGGAEVTVRGVCWSTSETPGFDDDCTNNGSGTGEFTSLLEDLSPDTKYYVRAYATNKKGIGYGDILSFRTNEEENQPPTVEITGGPSDGETINYTDPEFEWEGSDEDGSVEEYSVELDGPVSEEFTTDDTDHQFEDLSFGDYEFRVRAVDNDGANSDWASREFSIEQDVTRPVVTTSEISSITETSAESGGDVTDDGGDEVSVRGVCWSTSENPEADDDCTNDGSGEGEFTSFIEDLSPDTKYYVRAYAVNIEGIGYGDQRSFTTEAEPDNDDWPRDAETEVVDVTNPETGKTWMDRNLGASRPATSPTDEQAYGDLYQWGRPADGHQKRNSETTTTLSNSDQPGHDDFIVNDEWANDWRSPQNDNLWQGANGINNPCPSGYRLPTYDELFAEVESWSSDDYAAGAFASPLKLPLTGGRDGTVGLPYEVGTEGLYWTSDALNAGAEALGFDSKNFVSYGDVRAHGHSVRCIKD